MGLQTDKWKIAFRKKQGYEDIATPYIPVPGDRDGWYADPFLFEWQGRTWLFAEYFSYQTRKGRIVCCEYEPAHHGFSPWREALREPFHLSYPFVFADKGSIYMLPEAAESGQLLLYRAKSFPDRWECATVLRQRDELVDTTPLPDGKTAIAYRQKNGEPAGCVLLSMPDAAQSRDLTALRPLLRSRPGGRIFSVGDGFVHPAQDGEKTYGGSLVFYQSDAFLTAFSPVFTLLPEQITVKGEHARLRGIHTYNCTAQLEVIDYKIQSVSAVRIAHRLLQKAGFEK